MDKRIQFDLRETEIKELDLLMFQMGIKTRKDLFNNALTLLFWAVRQRKDGRRIASIDNNETSYRELSMPALDYIK